MGELGLVIEKKRGLEEEGERRGGEVYGGGDRKKDVDRGNRRECGAGEVQGGGFNSLCYVFM